MHSITQLLVQDRIEQLHRDAAKRRDLPAQATALARITDALRTVRTAVTTPASTRESRVLPALLDYPYRG